MLQCEREKLYNRDSEYLSIGISEDGTPTEDILYRGIQRQTHIT